jgi:hypothetical protein
MSATDERNTLPRWARALDVIGVGLVLIALSALVTGGFRESLPFGRISITSPWRPLALAIVVMVVRHVLRPRPSLFSLGVAAMKAWHGSPETRVVLPLVLATRLGVFAVGFLALSLIGYAPGAPPWRIYPNDFLNLPARWDTGWYLSVAVNGYEWRPAEAANQQNIAFFPLFPMLMRYGSLFLARQAMWVGVAISFVSFFLALRYLYRLASRWMDAEHAAAAVALIAVYPFAFFYSTAYTESLFLLTAVAACYHFERDGLGKAALWGFAAGLTRPNGCLLSVPLAIMALRPLSAHGWRPLPLRLAAASAPGLGMVAYSAYIYALTGNPLQWIAQNAAWGRVYRGFDVLLGERIDFLQQHGLYEYASNRTLDMLYLLALLLMLGSVWPVYRRFGLPYALMIVVNVLPPLAMGGLLSMGRVTSVIFPTFLWLGVAVPARHRTGWLVGFAMLQALCAIAFFTWRPLY